MIQREHIREGGRGRGREYLLVKVGNVDHVEVGGAGPRLLEVVWVLRCLARLEIDRRSKQSTPHHARIT